MNKTKTEDLINFGPKKKEEISFHVTLYKDRVMLRVQIFHAKTRLALEKNIHSYIDAQWPAEKDKISYKIR
ncbi:MAG: hypothetical protein KAT69_10615 [Candidatus Aminicenantes bacterium]|nr:hypothetical protein [Candidatus Aminicenantes bacterium]